MSNLTALHQPVLLEQALTWLKIQPQQYYVDATFGRGGHTRAMLQKGAKVIAFDFDQQAIEYGQKQFAKELTTQQLILIQANFIKLAQELSKLQPPVKQIAGILFDFGTTVDQLKDPERGFSFDTAQANLDMRMDQTLNVKAQDLLKVMTTKQLTKVFQEYGGENQASKIAKAIDQARKNQDFHQLETVGGLVKLILAHKKPHRGKLHPATKVFQALRIAVNDELHNIRQALPQALALLKKQSRIVTIAFHEGEDRIVKKTFKNWQRQEQGKILTKKVVKPTALQINQNPRARSAKLRAFEKK
ncbi:MAG: 16S rRNA (cytosine(1402)-N(4))-methyltransferase RsmH [Candidatus Pacebacteria bacterium]|nr:16S rRNA (cytosine(1402)-N(4))-methyltransferase RsmH [Candidatus Paceibacterota bacterium]